MVWLKNFCSFVGLGQGTSFRSSALHQYGSYAAERKCFLKIQVSLEVGNNGLVALFTTSKGRMKVNKFLKLSKFGAAEPKQGLGTCLACS